MGIQWESYGIRLVVLFWGGLFVVASRRLCCGCEEVFLFAENLTSSFCVLFFIGGTEVGSASVMFS